MWQDTAGAHRQQCRDDQSWAPLHCRVPNQANAYSTVTNGELPIGGSVFDRYEQTGVATNKPMLIRPLRRGAAVEN